MAEHPGPLSVAVKGTIAGLSGTAAIAVASPLVPAMGLTPSPTGQPKRISAMQLGYHLVFGWVTALTFWLLTLRD